MFHRLHEGIKSSKSVDFICVSDLSLLHRAPQDLYGFIVGLERNWEGVSVFSAESKGMAGRIRESCRCAMNHLSEQCQRLQRSRANPLLLVTGRRGCSDEKNLVRHKCSVWQLLSRRIDDIAGSECDLFWCDFHHWDTWRHGDRLRAVLILDYQGSAAVFLYRAVGHA